MEQNNTIMVGSIAAAALILGLGGGYFFGTTAGHAEGIEQGAKQEKAAEAARREAADREAARAVNPFNQSSGDSFAGSSNPLEDVRVNPFE